MKYVLIGCGRVAPSHVKAALANGLIREEELDVICILGVEGQLIRSVLVPSEVLRMDSDPVDVEVHPLLSPVREPLLVRAGLAEPLHLHLLELT